MLIALYVKIAMNMTTEEKQLVARKIAQRLNLTLESALTFVESLDTSTALAMAVDTGAYKGLKYGDVDQGDPESEAINQSE